MAGPPLAHARSQLARRAALHSRAASSPASRCISPSRNASCDQHPSSSHASVTLSPWAAAAGASRLRTRSASPSLPAPPPAHSRHSSASSMSSVSSQMSAGASAIGSAHAAVAAATAAIQARLVADPAAPASASVVRASPSTAPHAPTHSNIVTTSRTTSIAPPVTSGSDGPVAEYDRLVASGALRDDPHQRITVSLLQALHTELQSYTPPSLPAPKAEKRLVMAQVGNDAGRDKIKSPDFAWIEDNEKSVFGMVLGLFQSLTTGITSGSAAVNAQTTSPRGLYLYGDVGTGKTMTMDLFYKHAPVSKKRRVHFHSFMQDVHKRIHQLREVEGITSDPIPLVAAELANEAWLLCFDELQVNDITDAMLIRRLFSELIRRGVVMVMTSNRNPDDLYQNGIQRASFLPAISLIKERCLVHSLNSGIDYRRRAALSRRTYFTPLDIETDDILRRLFVELRGSTPVVPRELSFWGRTLVVREASGRIAKISFQQLCGEPHSAADYLEIAKAFDVVLLIDVPCMTMAQRNEARRFITLIDALYDHKTKLVSTMETSLTNLFSGDAVHTKTAPSESSHRLLMDDLKLSTDQLSSSIFTGTEEVFAFQRAVSRLVEMQSQEWVGDHLARALKKVTS